MRSEIEFTARRHLLQLVCRRRLFADAYVYIVGYQ